MTQRLPAPVTAVWRSRLLAGAGHPPASKGQSRAAQGLAGLWRGVHVARTEANEPGQAGVSAGLDRQTQLLLCFD